MKTRLSSLAEGVIECSWLTALIVIPVLWNCCAERIVEEKSVALRSIAVLSTAFGLCLFFERGWKAWLGFDRTLWWHPLFVASLLWALVLSIATLFSIAPSVSFWGSYDYGQGTYLSISYWLFFLLIVFTLRSPVQVRRVITVALLSSLPVAFYGIMQHYGLDPIVWSTQTEIIQQRVTSFAGNPIFLAAYLIMLVPLTILRLTEHIRLLSSESARNTQEELHRAPFLHVVGYSLLLCLQLLAILFTQSRGPWLGLVVSFLIVGSIVCAQRRWRRIMLVALSIGICGLIFLILFNLPHSPLAFLREAPYIGRLGQVLEDKGSGRIAIWKSVERVLSDRSSRLLFGYGPATLSSIFPRHFPPELVRLRRVDATTEFSPHNECLAALVERGIAGLLTDLLLFGSVFYCLLRRLGLIESKRQRLTFLILLAVGALMGGLVSYLARLDFVLCGIGIPAGIIAGMLWYIIVCVFSAPDTASGTPQPYNLELLALLAAVVAHFVEVQSAIPTTSTRLLFWIFLALIVVLQRAQISEETRSAVKSVPVSFIPVQSKHHAKPRNRLADGRRTVLNPRVNPALLSLTLLIGILLSALVFDFLSPLLSLSEWSKWGVIAGISMICIAGQSLLSSDVVASGQLRDRLSNRWRRAGISSVVALFFLGLGAGLLQDWKLPPEISNQEISNRAGQLMALEGGFYLYLLFAICVGGVLLAREHEPFPSEFSRQKRPWLSLLAVALAVLASWHTNLQLTRGEIWIKLSARLQAQGQVQPSIYAARKATEARPREAEYFRRLGWLYYQAATQRAAPSQQNTPAFQQAINALNRAREINPFNVRYPADLARLHRSGADLAKSRDERERHLTLADKSYVAGLALSPSNVTLWNEWALLAEEWPGNPDLVLERFNRSQWLDPKNDMTYVLLGGHYLNIKDPQAARKAYRKAIELQPENLQAWYGLTAVYNLIGDLPAAVRATLRGLRINPEDYGSHCNAVMLYRKVGDREKALRHAEQALIQAPTKDRQGISRIIAELRAAGESGRGNQ
jgi:tetratricopeptide (TPR) repeat protein